MNEFMIYLPVRNLHLPSHNSFFKLVPLTFQSFSCVFCLFLSLVLVSNNDLHSFAKCFRLFENDSPFFLAGCFFKVVYVVWHFLYLLTDTFMSCSIYRTSYQVVHDISRADFEPTGVYYFVC